MPVSVAGLSAIDRMPLLALEEVSKDSAEALAVELKVEVEGRRGFLEAPEALQVFKSPKSLEELHGL